MKMGFLLLTTTNLDIILTSLTGIYPTKRFQTLDPDNLIGGGNLPKTKKRNVIILGQTDKIALQRATLSRILTARVSVELRQEK